MEQTRTDSMDNKSDKGSSKKRNDEETTRLLDQILPAAGANKNAILVHEFLVKSFNAKDE